MKRSHDLIHHFLITAAVLAVLLWGATSPVGNVAMAEGATPMAQMAEIMHRLKHFPSPQGKETLKQIVADESTTANQRVLATAMLNLEHTVDPQDAPKLRALMADASASPDEKALAEIILNLDHRPTKQNKARVKMMMH